MDGGSASWSDVEYSVRARIVDLLFALSAALLGVVFFLGAATVANLDTTPDGNSGNRAGWADPVRVTGVVESCHEVGPISWRSGFGSWWWCDVSMWNPVSETEAVYSIGKSVLGPDDVRAAVALYARCDPKNGCELGDRAEFSAGSVLVQLLRGTLWVASVIATVPALWRASTGLLPVGISRRLLLADHSPRSRVREIDRQLGKYRMISTGSDPARWMPLPSAEMARRRRRSIVRNALAAGVSLLLTAVLGWYLGGSIGGVAMVVSVLVLIGMVASAVSTLNRIADSTAQRYSLVDQVITVDGSVGRYAIDLLSGGIEYVGPGNEYRQIVERGFDSQRPVVLPPLCGRYDAFVAGRDTTGVERRIWLARKAARCARNGSEIEALAAVLSRSPHATSRAAAQRIREHLALTQEPYTVPGADQPDR